MIHIDQTEFTITGKFMVCHKCKIFSQTKCKPCIIPFLRILIFSSRLFRNGPAISAICIYSLSSINRIFSASDFKSFTSETKVWTTKRNNIEEYFPGVSTG